MKSKRSILGELTRDELAHWASFYELDVADRRVRDDLVEALAHSKKARLHEILIELSRDRLKEICRGLELSDRGRAKATLVERLTGEPSDLPGDTAADAMSEEPLVDRGDARPKGPGAKLSAKLVERHTPASTASATDSAPPRRVPPASDLPAGPAGTKMALRRFSLQAATGFRGRDAGVDFARALIGCFGWTAAGDKVASAGVPDEVVFGHPISTLDGGKRQMRTVAAYWPARRVLVEVVERDLLLDMAWKGLQVACLQMEAEPQYVVLTNQRDLRLYDLARDRTAPRLTISVDELPKYSEAFPFFATDWAPGATPKIINVDKVSKEVADLVAKVYRALLQKNPGRQEDAIRFTLQCIIAMFAEDIGLLPKEYFTTLLYQAAEEGDAMARIGALFEAMSTEPGSRGGGADADIPYFNGGLFTDPVSLELGATPLRALTKAAEANWTFVDPHIFGSVFQGIMGEAERHASGAHYTAREDIMSVVGPTIVEPWRERINAASTLADLRAILVDFASYRVLDPACGSGNFLYVAFRELYKLETEVLCRIAEFASMQSGKNQLSWASAIRTTNFFGIDINPFAVELAKTTLNIAKKIAFEERKATVQELFAQGFLQVDPSLPLDNLDQNVVCADALFTEWPPADAIVGNPPFLAGSQIRSELGSHYLERLQDQYSTGGGDLCVFWFRRAHVGMRPHGRAGFIATSAIRFGLARETSLDFIANNDGYITNAVSSKPWPGDAAVNMSVVNWSVDKPSGLLPLAIGNRVHHQRVIHPHLQLHSDVSVAVALAYSPTSMTEGVKFGSEAFQLPPRLLRSVQAEGAARRIASGSDILGGRLKRRPRSAIWLADSDTEEEAHVASPTAFRHLQEHFYPHVAEQAADAKAAGIWKQWIKRWWKPWAPRGRPAKRSGRK